jgi:hypothetical protein
MGYHRCHGESRRIDVLHDEVGAGVLCMDVHPTMGGNAARARLQDFSDWVCSEWTCCEPAPKGDAVRAARGRADHLKHQGFLLGTWEPRFERRVGEPGKLPSLAMSRTRGGAFVVVRARESRVHGEGRQ